MTTRLPLSILILVSAVLLAACSSSSSSSDRPCRAVTGIDPPRLLKIMKSMDLEAEEIKLGESSAVRWTLRGSRTTVLFLTEGESLQFYVAMVGTGATSSFVNAWNKDWRYSRSYLDGDGDPVLELDLDLAGGVCEARIRDWLNTCVAAFGKWAELMPEAGSGTAPETAKPPQAPPSFPFPAVGPSDSGT
ncbi:MAG: YbjN domain-containing protein [Deltaproteobacteria bacterium]|jgi:hypothetical protein|nr:YbjN domain-containing protein [Deltaproteobacteria bacterium]